MLRVGRDSVTPFRWRDQQVRSPRRTHVGISSVNGEQYGAGSCSPSSPGTNSPSPGVPSTWNRAALMRVRDGCLSYRLQATPADGLLVRTSRSASPAGPAGWAELRAASSDVPRLPPNAGPTLLERHPRHYARERSDLANVEPERQPLFAPGHTDKPVIPATRMRPLSWMIGTDRGNLLSTAFVCGGSPTQIGLRGTGAREHAE